MMPSPSSASTRCRRGCWQASSIASTTTWPDATSGILFPCRATQATLQLLRLVGWLAPFLLMTAIFSQTVREAIGGLLKAKVVVVLPDEVASIETKQGQLACKQRRFKAAEIMNLQAVRDAARQKRKI